MKSLKQILLLLTFLTTIPVFGDNVYDEDEEFINIDIDPIKDNNKGTNPIGRPRSVNQQRIHCHYTNGTLFIQFTITEGNCELTVIDNETGESSFYNFDSSIGAFINIGNINSFDLYIETEKGSTYFGSK
ncbi:MAG: hypothetical protein K2I94_01205 [Muribaculaceae bacterium]|nr:hypothetical protein [Muribaculaceae bacterium]